MKIGNILLVATVAVAGLLAAQSVSAQTVTYDTTLTAINGTGNSDTGWSVYENPSGPTLGTMAQYNYPGYPGNATDPADPNNGSGMFIFPTGPKPGSLTRGQFDIWFSVETPNSSLADSGMDFYWNVTTTGPGTAAGPIELSLYPDNSYGNSSTPNSGGTAGTWAAMSGGNSLMQNAEDPSWLISGYDPNANQMLSVDVYAVTSGAGPSGTKLGEICSTIQVGVAPVPEPCTFALGGFGGLISLMAIRRKRS